MTKVIFHGNLDNEGCVGIEQTLIEVKGQHYVVSTVDFGLVHGGVLLASSRAAFETLIFPADSEGNITSWGEAAGHAYNGKVASEVIQELVTKLSAEEN